MCQLVFSVSVAAKLAPKETFHQVLWFSFSLLRSAVKYGSVFVTKRCLVCSQLRGFRPNARNQASYKSKKGDKLGNYYAFIVYYEISVA